LVVVNCSAVVETLFESELFGHVKGAFTGADRDKMGLAEHAHGGTLVLDEIGDMPIGTQAKMLRVLQDREVQRVGSLAPKKIDIRVVAVTNADLRSAVAAKRFREDLYYRLSMIEVQVPRLADRKEDLPLLTRHFLAKFSSEYQKQIRGLTHRAQIVLARHSWPGNIREFENVIGHACMLAMGDTIDIANLPEYLRLTTVPAGPLQSGSPAASGPYSLSSLKDQERQLILKALEESGNNQSKAARLLHIGRDSLRYRLKKYGLPVERRAAAHGA
jgi:transcriptional regulator with PAS, ATPase and Fis domain